ncbi:MAG: TetR/AcrR family transcriptional regulator [Flavobacterium sp.]|nr:TetR/AcrR family transcriptional regulator [Flavobacterium sp.]
MAKLKAFSEDVVLDKAIEIFWYKGYNGTSAQDLVNHLGLSRSSLYDTFGDKRSLFIKALERYQNKSLNVLKTALETADDVKLAIKQIFEQAAVESFQDSLTKGCFMVNTSVELAIHDTDIAAIVNKNRIKIEAVFLYAIERGQDKGQISKAISALALARFLFNNYSGIRVLSRSVINDKYVMQDIVKVISDVL